MKYLIFSDESGRWNEGEYYIRSWLRITPENYLSLRKEVLFAKYEVGAKELKWEKFKNNFDKFKTIFEPELNIFITLSKPSHLEKKKYKIIREIEKVKPSTGGQQLTEKIKLKIISSAKNELFLNYFEKQHIENSKTALLSGVAPQEYKYIVDSPQYLHKEWEDVAKESGIEQIEIAKTSSLYPGIEMADIVSGCLKELLENGPRTLYIYNQCIKDKMLDITTATIPNPNLIFYPDFSEQEKQVLNIFK